MLEKSGVFDFDQFKYSVTSLVCLVKYQIYLSLGSSY